MSSRHSIVSRCIFLLGVLGTAHAWAQTTQETSSKLDQVRQKIQDLAHSISLGKSDRDKALEELRKTESQMAETKTGLNKIGADLNQLEAQVQSLMGKQAQLEDARERQSAALAHDVRSEYQAGRTEYLKMLLNQDQPEKTSRILKYYDLFNRARVNRIQQYRATEAELESTKQQIQTQSTQLESLRAQLQEKQKLIAQQVAERQKIVDKLNSELSGKGAQLKQLQSDQSSLQTAIEKIQAEEKARAEAEAAKKREEENRKEAQTNKKKAPEPTEPPTVGAMGQDAQIDVPRTSGKIVSDESIGKGADNVPFRLAHGKLAWPTRGRIAAHFGQSREQGKLVWDGTLIQAPTGAPVRAIHAGRVELAQYLRGYGFIVILDHGGGYMSVYAYNESLARKKGDKVNVGDVIATVGNTGGQSIPALYFQIRYNGQAVDPAGWCR